MSNEVSMVAVIWDILKDFIPNKEKSDAAEQLVRNMSENFSNSDLHQLASTGDDYLTDAVDLILKEDLEEEDFAFEDEEE